MYTKRIIATVTTDGSQNATAYVDVPSGLLHSITYVPDGTNPYANTVDMTITVEGTGQAVLTKTDVAAGFTAAPRMPTHDLSGAALLYAAGGTAQSDKIAIANDRIKIVLAQGGATKVGQFHFVLA